MNSEAAIYGILSSDSTLTGLLATTTSIYPEIAPQSAAEPLIVYSETTPERSNNKSGASKLDIDLIQIDVYAKTVSSRNVIGARIDYLLNSYQPNTINGVSVQSIQIVNSYKTSEPQTGTDSLIYRQSLDAQIRQSR